MFEDWLDDCIPLTKRWEGCYLTAYPDPESPLAKAIQAQGHWQDLLNGIWPIPASLITLDATPWTIGYGSTGPGIVQGTVWTQAQADADLVHRLTYEFGPGVQAAVTVELSAKQMAACVDFTYQEGVEAFTGSTLRKLVNANQMTQAADEFLKWDVAGGSVVESILARRQADRALFLEGTS